MAAQRQGTQELGSQLTQQLQGHETLRTAFLLLNINTGAKDAKHALKQLNHSA